ncbi:hypothetical protein [Aeromonas salmonicida]|uniref:hypothetical protein n=1 Tax=Aeromonas salmonicida TaxID=645 RepID=UPI0039A6BA9E
MATPLPVCLKYENSSKGGCIVKCQGICVEMPLANSKGPVFTNGEACSMSSGNPEGSGDGSGDGDGGPDAPGSGSSGSTAFPGWYNFEPVIGDSTGTSVSGTVAKLNKNLGKALGNLAGSSSTISRQVNEIVGLQLREMNASEGAVELLKEIREYNKLINSHAEAENLYSSRNEARMEEVLIHLKKMADSKGGSGGDKDGDDSKLYDELKQFHLNTFGPNFAKNNEGGNFYELVRGYQYDVSSIKESVRNLDTTFSSFHWNTSQELRNNSIEMNRNIKAIAEMLKGNGGAGGDGSGSGNGAGDGSDIDYSKMPGSGDNPLSVQGGKYNSACQGKDCFFDVPAMQKKLDDVNKSLTDKYTTISSDVQKVFTFSLSGSADPMECLDLFSHQGKTYSVCPPTGDYWQTLAAIMMFVFYFIALMIIFKR